jgi:hypothetical protein
MPHAVAVSYWTLNTQIGPNFVNPTYSIVNKLGNTPFFLTNQIANAISRLIFKIFKKEKRFNWKHTLLNR